MEAFAKARQWIDKAIERAPTASPYQSNLAVLHRRVAAQQRKLNNADAQKSALSDGVAAADLAASLAAAREPAADQAARQLGRMHAHNELADWHQRHKDTRSALAARRSALAAVANAALLEPGQASHQDALRAAHRAIAKQETEPAVAETAWRAAADAALRAVALAPSADRFNEAAQSWFGLGNHLEAQDAWAPALLAYQGAAQQAELAVRSAERDAEHRLALSISQRKVAETLQQLPDRGADARAAFDAAILAGAKALELAPADVRHWQALYFAKWYLAVYLDRPAGSMAADRYLGEALTDAQGARKIAPDDAGIVKNIAELQEQIDARKR